jgi:hypothetical protein
MSPRRVAVTNAGVVRTGASHFVGGEVPATSSNDCSSSTAGVAATPTGNLRGMNLPLLSVLALLSATPAGGADGSTATSTLSAAEQAEILEATLTLRLAPDLAGLSAGERRALDELLAVGALFQDAYEQTLHPQATWARQQLASSPRGVAASLYRLFQGPVATTLDNRRVPFLPVAAEAPGKSFYPADASRAELESFLTDHPEQRVNILGERTVVRRATADNLAIDRAALARHPVLAALAPELDTRLSELAARPSASNFYAVPYAVAWADATVAAQQHLFRAADAVDGDDPELARYLRNRGRDLLANDYESGDAAWVTGRFRHLNAQIGAYETYDDALFGVKASPAVSILLRDEAATAELTKGLGALQGVEDALPYLPHKRVRQDISVGVYEVIADFGQARGTNTATILPNDPLFSRRYGRTILLRKNIMTHADLAARAARVWQAAVAPPFAADLSAEGPFQRTLWHEVGHYLGPDVTADGRSLDQALQGSADALEEMKSDLVSLFAVERFHQAGLATDERLRAVQASGILRTLQLVRPRRDQPYQTMQLAQMNWFLDRGLLSSDEAGRLVVHYERYADVVSGLLREVMALQQGGDPAAAEAFFDRWTTWSDELHEPLAKRLRAAQGKRFQLVRYAALGE